MTDQYVEQRKLKASQLRRDGVNPYPNGIYPTHTAQQIHTAFGAKTREELEAHPTKIESGDTHLIV